MNENASNIVKSCQCWVLNVLTWAAAGSVCGFCPCAVFRPLPMFLKPFIRDFHAHFSREARAPNRFNEGVDAHDPVLSKRVQAANALCRKTRLERCDSEYFQRFKNPRFQST